MVERGDKTSYEIGKANIQEVAERYNTTEQRTVQVSNMHANKLSNRPKKTHGQSMVTKWRICEKQKR